MKLNRLEIKDVLGVRELSLTMDKPITLIGGHNGAGKSSIAESVRMVFGASPERVRLKSEYGKIINENGGKKASVVIGVDGTEDGYMLSLPDGKTNGDFSDNIVLPYLLDIHRFANASPEDRISVLRAAAGIKIGRDAVKEKLIERGCSEEKSDQALLHLRGGFPAAVSYAEDMAKDARGAWRGVTGETYGAVKADSWTVSISGQRPTQDQIEEAKGLLNSATKARSDAAIALARATDSIKSYNEYVSSVPEGGFEKRINELTAKKDHELAKAKEYEAQLEEAESKAGGGQRVGLVHDLAIALHDVIEVYMLENKSEDAAEGAISAYQSYVSQYGDINAQGCPEATKQVPKLREAVQAMKTAASNTERDISTLIAKSELPKPKSVSHEDIDKLDEKSKEAIEVEKDARKLVDELTALENEHAQADSKEQSAKKHHADVKEWLVIRDALLPTGIPAEFMKSAIDPFNERLQQSSEDTGWRLVEVDGDMNITYGGRDYALLSASEKYRVDVMATEALSHISGQKMFMADAFDILEPEARTEFLGWLHVLADNNEVDTVIALGTMAQKPIAPQETFNTFFLTR